MKEIAIVIERSEIFSVFFPPLLLTQPVYSLLWFTTFVLTFLRM